MRHKLFIVAQVTFIALVLLGIFMFYPRVGFSLNGNTVKFNSINADSIILSNNPDFSNPRYLEINDSVSFNLKPGTYYWKASNGIFEGLVQEFQIDSKVGLEILEKENGHELKNVGDVKINVTRTKEGGFIGHIILEPEKSEEIENQGTYAGRQDE